MRKIIMCLLPALLLLSCQGTEMINPEAAPNTASACSVKNPLQQLPWLETMLDQNDPESEYCSIYQITQGNYEGKTVYIVAVSGALCCTCAGSSVYNCEGEIEFICEPHKEAKIVNKQVIWER